MVLKVCIETCSKLISSYVAFAKQNCHRHCFGKKEKAFDIINKLEFHTYQKKKEKKKKEKKD